MAKRTITSGFLKNLPPCPPGKTKMDYYDTQLPGFLVEVRPTGRGTYYQRYRSKSGRTRQARIGYVGSLTLEEARIKAKEIQSMALMGVDLNHEQEKLKAMPTTREFMAEHYLPYVKNYKRSWKMDQCLYNSKMDPVWGTRKLSEITRKDIEQIISSLLSSGKKPATVNRYMALIKYMFSLAEEWELIDKSPARGVNKLEENNTKERYLTAKETSSLLAELKRCTHTTVPDLIEFLIVTGARKGEAVNAKWEHINFDTGVWTVPLSKSGYSRQIVLSEAAIRILGRRNGLSPASPYVFANLKNGKPMKYFYHEWNKIRTKAGIEDVRIHDLRHNFASVLVNSGRSLYEVQKLLGHSDMKTTQRYAHLEKNTLKEAVNLAQSRIYAGENLGITG